MAMDMIAPDLDGAELRIGIVQARFNAWAGEALLAACLRELANLGVDEDDVTVLTVPGALEVPLALATLAATADFDALIGLGCVIRGDTYHFEIVADQSAAGLPAPGRRVRRSGSMDQLESFFWTRARRLRSILWNLLRRLCDRRFHDRRNISDTVTSGSSLFPARLGRYVVAIGLCDGADLLDSQRLRANRLQLF